jgi:serine/threonine protein kinase
VDASADLYALGAVGYFLLCGSPPFDARTLVEVCAMHLHQPPVPPSQRLGEALPAELEALVLSCLAKSKAERPPSAAALEDALSRCAERSPWNAADARAFWTAHKKRSSAPAA